MFAVVGEALFTSTRGKRIPMHQSISVDDQFIETGGQVFEGGLVVVAWGQALNGLEERLCNLTSGQIFRLD